MYTPNFAFAYTQISQLFEKYSPRVSQYSEHLCMYNIDNGTFKDSFRGFEQRGWALPRERKALLHRENASQRVEQRSSYRA